MFLTRSAKHLKVLSPAKCHPVSNTVFQQSQPDSKTAKVTPVTLAVYISIFRSLSPPSLRGRSDGGVERE